MADPVDMNHCKGHVHEHFCPASENTGTRRDSAKVLEGRKVESEAMRISVAVRNYREITHTLSLWQLRVGVVTEGLVLQWKRNSSPV